MRKLIRILLDKDGKVTHPVWHVIFSILVVYGVVGFIRFVGETLHVIEVLNPGTYHVGLLSIGVLFAWNVWRADKELNRDVEPKDDTHG